MQRRDALTGLALLPLWPALQARAAVPIHIFKNPSCDCCAGWVKHIESSGFAVKVTETDDTTVVRQRLGMPERFGSCHTATVDGYVLEGHVPAADIQRLLRQRPAAIGLAVPAMPVGSPGMEYGDRRDAYDVLLVGRGGDATVFAHYGSATPSAAKR
jgi:hypothetical protein